MPKFGTKSKNNLANCHKDLQVILNEAIKYIDFSVIEGARTAKRQRILFLEHRTTLDGVEKLSNHQIEKHDDGTSWAVDVAPYPQDWSNKVKAKERFVFLAGFIKAVAEILYFSGKIQHRIRQGVDWDGDLDFYRPEI